MHFYVNFISPYKECHLKRHETFAANLHNICCLSFPLGLGNIFFLFSSATQRCVQL